MHKDKLFSSNTAIKKEDWDKIFKKKPSKKCKSTPCSCRNQGKNNRSKKKS